MQTFLPYPNFHLSAKCLDNKRLGKQRVECLQILGAIADPSKGWQNHPAVNMWRGHELSLIQYGLIVCREWIARGFQDTCLDKIRGFTTIFPDTKPMIHPSWFGNEEFHLSHKSNLIRKLPSHYKHMWPDVPDNLPYVWPTKRKEAEYTLVGWEEVRMVNTNKAAFIPIIHKKK